jgi:hypothetical protein
MARLIDGLAVLRAEFDKINPQRDRSSDGWIGDDRHAAIASDHNPDGLGYVRALDVDVDGVPMGRIVASVVNRCRSGAETRLQYVIYRRVIWSRSWGWKARKYLGANPHIRHAHFSARHGDVAGSTAPWGIAGAFAPRLRPAGKPAAHPAGTRMLELQSPPLVGADVVYVQRWIGEGRCGPADGRYGPKTRAGVRWYQGMRGLSVDGVVGPATWRHMGVRWTGGRSA